MAVNNERISVKTKLGNEVAIFHLRMISSVEERELRQRYTDLKEDEKADKDYKINVDALAEFSVEVPQTEDDKGQFIPLVNFEKYGDPASAVREYFEQRGNVKERIANYAVIAFMNRLTPEISFL
jgi:hypothetical protein